MMDQAIRDFPKQFKYEPVIERGELLPRTKKFLVSGMGGSHLAADLLKNVYPALPLEVHVDYGLPVVSDGFNDTLFVASSYSGNTEEIIDGLEEAYKKGIPSAAVSIGGRLESLAREYSLPFIKIPDTGIQPRSALGFSLLALMKVMRMEKETAELRALADALHLDDTEAVGKKLASKLYGKVPVIYASRTNKAIAYNWKIKCNETGKIPAFYNTFSELNHNEMTGFDVIEQTKPLSEKFHFIFLTDSEDTIHIKKRMDICKNLYEARGLPVTEISLKGGSRWERIFNSLLCADWFAFHTGTTYGVETEQVPMVEEFKKLIA